MILAFDIGGSRIRAALWDGAALAPLGEVPTPTQDRAAFLAAIAGFAKGRDLRGLALAVAGVVDPATGVGRVANIPAIDGLDLARALEAAVGLPVLVRNDADCFALAEARLGAGRGHGIVLGLILGTGIGGGLVIDGRLVRGARGVAGEWGHGPVIRGDHAFPCACGQTGCVETIGSARGLERLHLARGGGQASSHDLVAGWRAGEPGASATLDLWRDLVAGPLAMVVNALGPGAVPVGGGLGGAKGLVAWLDEAVRARILRPGEQALLVPAVHGPEAGLLGAGLAGAAEWG
jgi:N-acetylglucosamine kinase